MFCKHHAVQVTCAVCVLVCITVADCLAVDEQNNYEKLENEVAELKAEVEQLKSAQRATRSEDNSSGGNRGTGTTYIRWGRTICGSGDARILYRGHAAGAHYNLGGGGSNHLCLHETPQWAKTGGFRGQIYGVEFELFDDGDIFSTENHGGYSLRDYPSPCAACYVPTRSAVIMIPARTECPPQWTKEYQGYIVSEHISAMPGRHRNQYTCWDSAPESASGGTSQNQAVIYPVQATCGSLPCSRYVNGRALTCVVCTK